MRDFSTTLLSAAASTVTTLGWLMSITALDGTAIYMNSFGKDVLVGGHTYSGNPGFDMGDVRFSDTDPPAVQVRIPIDSGTPITFDDASRRKYDQARVRLYLIDWSSLEYVEIGSKWYVGPVTALDSKSATIEIRAIERSQKELMLKVVGPGCKWDLGDAGCNVDIAGSWQDTISVDTYTDAFTFSVVPPSPAPADDYYNEGAIKFTSGQNGGFSYSVRQWIQSGSILKLWEPLRFPVANGDTATIYPGCDKSTGANGCGRFSNISRRLAHEYLPVGDLTFDVSDTKTWA